jgi:hypothetical protein
MKEYAVGQTGGELAYGAIKGFDCLIVALAGNIYPVFRSFELGLQIEKILVGFQIGIPFDHQHKSAESRIEAALGLLELGQGRRITQVVRAKLHRRCL